MRTLGTTLTALLLVALLAACGDDPAVVAEDRPTSPASPGSPAPTAAEEESSAPARPQDPEGLESTTLPFQGLDFVGAWETGELLGERLPAGTAAGRPQILYAVTGAESEDGLALVSTGLEEDDRIFRLIPALVPESEEAADGIDLYGGNLLDWPDGRKGSYELMGAVPGTVTVSIEGPDGRSVEATSQSDAVLPGWTVFYHRARWQPGWDEIQLAPVVVTTDEGARVEVRERSWVG